MKDGNFGGYKYTKIQKTYIVDEEDEEVESSCYCWTCMKSFVKTLKLQLLKIQVGECINNRIARKTSFDLFIIIFPFLVWCI